MTELAGGESHLLDRRATVGPVGVRVQVAAQRVPQRLPAGRERLVGRPFEVGEITRFLAARGGACPRAGGGWSAVLAILERYPVSSPRAAGAMTPAVTSPTPESS